MRAPAAFALGTAVMIVVACGGGRKDDSGYGAGEPVPATLSCVDLCARLGDCVVALCNEDTDSTRYSGLEDALAFDCETSCTEAAIEAAFTDDQWACIFQSSCREVFDYQECDEQSFYTCD